MTWKNHILLRQKNKDKLGLKKRKRGPRKRMLNWMLKDHLLKVLRSYIEVSETDTEGRKDLTKSSRISPEPTSATQISKSRVSTRARTPFSTSWTLMQTTIRISGILREWTSWSLGSSSSWDTWTQQRMKWCTMRRTPISFCCTSCTN